MQEIVLTDKKNGMATLILGILAELLTIVGVVFGSIMMEEQGSAFGTVLFAVSLVLMCVAWIPLLGLRILRPNEALVLTLFGKYVGTLKGEGFYAINPFCASVNPAAGTKLNQSGDVGQRQNVADALNSELGINTDPLDKKISLKIMTLNNNRQKINDCLGNPVEIGIAVMWRVVDTAKAVFNVDNYKEYLSL